MGDRCAADLSPSRPWFPPPPVLGPVSGVWDTEMTPAPREPPNLEVGATCHGEQVIGDQASEVTGSRGWLQGPSAPPCS